MPPRPSTAPALLADPLNVELRRALLDQPHMRPLRAFVQELRATHELVPDVDPLDGGTRARLLILLETPGPKIRASGIVSRDNPSGTGRNLRAALAAAAIARADTLLWNAVPWVIHAMGARNRTPRAAELVPGIQALRPLLALLPRLRVVVMAGRIAGCAADLLAEARPELRLIHMPHPSPANLCTSPAVRARLRDALAEAGRILRQASDGPDGTVPPASDAPSTQAPAEA